MNLRLFQGSLRIEAKGLYFLLYVFQIYKCLLYNVIMLISASFLCVCEDI